MVTSLLLVPTQFELDYLTEVFCKSITNANYRIELCGFGPIVSGILATRLIAQYQPKKVLLTGLAGCLDPRLKTGTAVEFDEVVCYGIGAGSGTSFITAQEMGWSQWYSDSNKFEIKDSITLESDQFIPLAQLLTCCAASGNEQDVQMKKERFPNAVAEDMEGFAVAAACRLASVPLRIIRAISNQAGDRNKSNWRVCEAMAAVELEVLRNLNQ